MSKNRFFLEKLERAYNKVKKIEKLTRSGLRGKMERLILSPNVYIPYILWRLNFYPCKNRKIKLFWGKTIESDLDSNDIFMLHRLGMLTTESEYKLTKFFIKNLKDNDIFYDVGANYGFYTHLALEFCREVHSFEPLPAVFQCLEKNLKRSEKSFLNNKALSNECGPATLYVPNSNDLGRSTLNIAIKNDFWEASHQEKKIAIQTTTLDDYLKDHSGPNFLKLDTEGSESHIIDGGIGFFQNSAPVIAMEVWGSKTYKISEEAIVKLRNLGYQSYFINPDGELEKIDGDLSGHINSKVGFDNFIFQK